MNSPRFLLSPIMAPPSWWLSRFCSGVLILAAIACSLVPSTRSSLLPALNAMLNEEGEAPARFSIEVKGDDIFQHPTVSVDLKETLSQSIGRMKEDFIASLIPQNKTPRLSPCRSSLTITITVGVILKHLESVMLKEEQFMCFSAHPTHTVHPILYDPAARKMVSPKTLFPQRPFYLETLSSKSRERLKEVVGDTVPHTWIAAGTEPTPENFSNLFIVSDGVIVLFGDYQVAPYSERVHEMFLPWSDLVEIIGGTSPLLNLVEHRSMPESLVPSQQKIR